MNTEMTAQEIEDAAFRVIADTDIEAIVAYNRANDLNAFGEPRHTPGYLTRSIDR